MSAQAVVVYCRPACPGCGTLTHWFDDHRVAWSTRDVLADTAAADRVTRLGYLSLPVVETHDGRSAWGGDLRAVAALFPGRPARSAASASDAEPGVS